MSAVSAPPASLGFFMPPEWGPHAATWMAFPASSYMDGEGYLEAASKWAEVANVIGRHEPVVMVVAPEHLELAAQLLSDRVTVVSEPLDDSWMRDIGPTFLVTTQGQLGAIDWTFNGWGAQAWARWGHDSLIGRAVAERAGARVFRSDLVNEGGAFHVDGDGLVLATETVQLDPGRNPDWTKAEVERELHGALGTRQVVWLPRGLTADYLELGTRGHVDMLAAFVGPGRAVIHNQRDPGHPDYEVSQQARAALESAGIEVVPLHAPASPTDGPDLVDWSYVNFYVGNGFVLMGTFGQEDADGAAGEVLASAFPGRRVEGVDARLIFEYGGGIHCITQQQPGVRA